MIYVYVREVSLAFVHGGNVQKKGVLQAGT